MMKKNLFILLLCLCSALTGSAQYNADNVEVSAIETELYNIIMQYRAQNGLPKIPLSPALCYVAQTHAKDVVKYYNEIPNGCNPHSWSGHGSWSRCDYYPDHRNAAKMWNKPKELTGFRGNGYENVFYYLPPSSHNCNAKEALEAWKKSYGHNILILNLDNWADMTWRAIGVGVYKGFACMWVSDTADNGTSGSASSSRYDDDDEDDGYDNASYDDDDDDDDSSCPYSNSSVNQRVQRTQSALRNQTPQRTQRQQNPQRQQNSNDHKREIRSAWQRVTGK